MRPSDLSLRMYIYLAVTIVHEHQGLTDPIPASAQGNGVSVEELPESCGSGRKTLYVITAVIRVRHVLRWHAGFNDVFVLGGCSITFSQLLNCMFKFRLDWLKVLWSQRI